MKVEQGIFDEGIGLPVSETKFDAHTARVSNDHASKFASLPDDFKMHGLARLSR